MESILELIQEIEKRPAMYISKNYISCLKSFLDGWCLRNMSDISDIKIMGDFHNWIVNKYKITSSHSWNDIILFYSQDETDALYNFFISFRDFLNHSPLSQVC